MGITEFVKTFNAWSRDRIPFLFVVDFEMERPLLFKIQDINPNHILFDINGFTNTCGHAEPVVKVNHTLEKYPISLQDYKKKFDAVFDFLRYGDSYLTNLTIKTAIRSTNSLRELFHLSKAKYKLLFEDEFLVFSPEIFVQIKDGKIFSYPMKGTIDASIPNAKETILQDPKELAEHITIVDLIRNDLSLIASHVNVSRFRYIEEIKTNTKSLLQVSSEINGVLPENYLSHLGTLLVALLPAGSVSGAPKNKTVDIIRNVENEKRNYYTGVFGYFDGDKLDSGVMIRYIENRNGLYYRSGGGITAQSTLETEYLEMIDKIYVPLN